MGKGDWKRNVRIYKIDEKTGKIELDRPLCRRCGRVMAKHHNRYSCGYCGYTIFFSEGKEASK